MSLVVNSGDRLPFVVSCVGSCGEPGSRGCHGSCGGRDSKGSGRLVVVNPANALMVAVTIS